MTKETQNMLKEKVKTEEEEQGQKRHTECTDSGGERGFEFCREGFGGCRRTQNG